uniref:Uncharacterized protein n=1 Tax=Anopheles dirus TaxID=7168 RepID=A0A182NTG8_9DIPT
MTEARLNSSQVIFNFHTDVISSKDQYVRATIEEEDQVLTILDRQPEAIDRTCLGFVRNSVDTNVNLVGVSYTNCIVRVDDALAGIVHDFYLTIQADETQYTGSDLFGVFRGENIFHAPDSIVQKLTEKLEELRDNPTYIATELFDLITEFELELGQVKVGYDGCLESGTQLLRSALEIARTQLVQADFGYAREASLISKMKFVVVLLLASVAWAQRPDSVAVVNKLYEVHPLYRQIQDYVINTITDARLSSSSKIYDFHKEVILVKSTFLGTSIKQEQELLTQVNGQPASVDQMCLTFIRQSAEVNMNLAGVSYTNCITAAGDTLVSTVKSFYDRLDVNEAAYVGVGLFEEFRGQNVFFDPRTIIAKLESRVARLEDYPTHIGSELLDAISGFSNSLDNIRMAYVSCMTMGEQLLKSSLQLALLQLEEYLETRLKF